MGMPHLIERNKAKQKTNSLPHKIKKEKKETNKRKRKRINTIDNTSNKSRKASNNTVQPQRVSTENNRQIMINIIVEHLLETAKKSPPSQCSYIYYTPLINTTAGLLKNKLPAVLDRNVQQKTQYIENLLEESKQNPEVSQAIEQRRIGIIRSSEQEKQYQQHFYQRQFNRAIDTNDTNTSTTQTTVVSPLSFFQITDDELIDYINRDLPFDNNPASLNTNSDNTKQPEPKKFSSRNG